MLGVNRDEMRGAVRDTISTWRHDIDRVGNLRSEVGEKAMQRLGILRRERKRTIWRFASRSSSIACGCSSGSGDNRPPDRGVARGAAFLRH